MPLSFSSPQKRVLALSPFRPSSNTVPPTRESFSTQSRHLFSPKTYRLLLARPPPHRRRPARLAWLLAPSLQNCDAFCAELDVPLVCNEELMKGAGKMTNEALSNGLLCASAPTRDCSLASPAIDPALVGTSSLPFLVAFFLFAAFVSNELETKHNIILRSRANAISTAPTALPPKPALLPPTTSKPLYVVQLCLPTRTISAFAPARPNPSSPSAPVTPPV